MPRYGYSKIGGMPKMAKFETPITLPLGVLEQKHFLPIREPFWVPVTPSTMKFEILTLPYHFHIKFMLESTKKT